MMSFDLLQSRQRTGFASGTSRSSWKETICGCRRHQSSRCRATAEDKITKLHRRSLFAASLLLTEASRGAFAAGIESIPLPSAGDSKYEAVRKRNRELLEQSTEAFENSDILKSLKEKTALNKDKNKRALQDRYCYRQAELGVGDCGGLRLIPGATKSGKQKTPEWLQGVLKKLGRLPADQAASDTVAEAQAGAVEE